MKFLKLPLLFILLMFVSQPANANPIPVVPTPISTLDRIVTLFFVNFPINTTAYTLFLLISARNFGLFKISTTRFVGRAFLVSTLATIIGAFIHVIPFSPGYSYMPPSTLEVIVGLPLVFFSFVLLGWEIQKLKFRDAAFIGLNMSVVNAVFWGYFSFREVPWMTIIPIVWIAYFVFIIALPVAAFWHHQKLST